LFVSFRHCIVCLTSIYGFLIKTKLTEKLKLKQIKLKLKQIKSKPRQNEARKQKQNKTPLFLYIETSQQ